LLLVQFYGKFIVSDFNNMATRKKRQAPQVGLTADQPKPTVRYEDEFQQTVGHKVEEIGKKFEGKGKTILYAILGVIALGILISLVMSWSRRSNFAEQTALGKAIEVSQRQVTDQPPPATSTQKVFKTEKERAEASVAEFQSVVDKFGSEKAKYFVAVNKLGLDRPTAITELEGLSKTTGEVGSLSKFALAQAKVSDGKNDEAIALFTELASASDSVVSKDTINFNLAGLLDKQGKKTEAADIYFNIAKAASELKDADGKPKQLSQTARESKEKLKTLNPEKAKEIVEAPPEMPGMPGM
jgi:hypothetical protein